MKKIISIITLSLCSFYAFTQKDSVPSISSWNISEDFFGKDLIDIDTSIESIQFDNPVNKYYFSNSSLGNYGSPCISNTFFERNEKNEFLFLNNYYPYLFTWDKTLFVNTRRQFTKLSYINGGGSTDKEEILEVFHTQNVNKKLNFGLKYNTNASSGQYRFQRTKRNSFNFFSSYDGDYYTYDFSINTNNFIVNQNGGIVSDTLLLPDYYQSPADLITVFKGEGSQPRETAYVVDTFKNLNFIMVHNINLSEYLKRNDTLSTDSLSKKTSIGLMVITKYETDKRLFSDKVPQTGIEAGLYDSIYYNKLRTFDSIYYRKLENTVRLYIKDNKTNILYADLSNELIKYNFTSKDQKSRKYPSGSGKKEYPFNYNFFESNLKISAGAISNTHLFNIYLYGYYYLSGYKQGNYHLNTSVSLLDKSRIPDISGSIGFSSEKPFYLYQHYFSNYFNWSENFKPLKNLRLSLKYSHSPNKFESELNYALLRGHIFFDTSGFPKQYNKLLSVLELRIFKNFNFWKFSSLNKLAFQYVNNETILGIPNVCFNNSTFFKQDIHFNFTGGGFTALLGFDIYYDTKYYGYAYMPPTASFIRQVEKKIGGYPVVDIFLNIKLKRALFFFKFEHINSGLIDRNYFSILHYPRAERMFKAGISWNFYD